MRIIVATNKPPQQMLAEGFRMDLLYRLNVLNLDIPPLRRRENDVLLIFRGFVKIKMQKKGSKKCIAQPAP